jgi:general secretion pathway protein L
MAATPLKHGLVWLPSRAGGERALVSEAVLMACEPGQAPDALQPVRCSIDALPRMRSALLLVDACDVSLHAISLPPLSGARLLRALPNLLEDRLLQDASACAFALGPSLPDGQRMVAVIDRAWLEFACGAFERRGVRLVGAWPAQLALPAGPEGAFVLACVGNTVILRAAPWRSLAGHAGSDPAQHLEALEAMVAIASVGDSPAGAPAGAFAGAPGTLHAHAADVAWRQALESFATRRRLGIELHPWAIDTGCPIDLLTARPGSAGRRRLAAIDWRAWRLPAALAAASLLVSVFGLNLHWLQLQRERSALRERLEATFREAFPQAQVVVDPLLQMQRLVGDRRALAGRSAHDDVLPLATRLARALGTEGLDALAGLDYRENRLRVRWRVPPIEPAQRERITLACARAGLAIRFEPDGSAIVSLGESA